MTNEREGQMNILMQSIKRSLKQLHSLVGLSSELDAFVFALPQERSQTKLVRAFFIWGIGAYIDEIAAKDKVRLRLKRDKVLFNDQLPFIAEIVLCLQYLDNQIFDRKKGVDNIIGIRNNIVYHNILERGLNIYIERYIPKAHLHVVKSFTYRALDLADIGQYIEGKYNSFAYFNGVEERHTEKNNKLPRFNEVKNYLESVGFNKFVKRIKELFPKEYHNFIHLYLLRIALTSSAMFVQFTKLVIALKGYSGKHKQNIIEHAFTFGMIIQLVNDITDFVPSAYQRRTVAKNPTDCFSDIKNKNITLPIALYLLHKNNKLDINKLEEYTEGHFYKGTEGKRLRDVYDTNNYVLNCLSNDITLSAENEKLLLLEICPVLFNFAIPIAQKWTKTGSALLEPNYIGSLLIDLMEVSDDNQYYREMFKIWKNECDAT